VESLAENPVRKTHGSVLERERELLGTGEGLVRLGTLMTYTFEFDQLEMRLRIKSFRDVVHDLRTEKFEMEAQRRRRRRIC
jgi:hypothetical protein